MGVRILNDIDTGACLYESTSMKAFGPVFEDSEDAEAFLKLMYAPNQNPGLDTDAELNSKYSEYVSNRVKCDGCQKIGLKDLNDLPDGWEDHNGETLCDECMEIEDIKEGEI